MISLLPFRSISWLYVQPLLKQTNLNSTAWTELLFNLHAVSLLRFGYNNNLKNWKLCFKTSYLKVHRVIMLYESKYETETIKVVNSSGFGYESFFLFHFWASCVQKTKEICVALFAYMWLHSTLETYSYRLNAYSVRTEFQNDLIYCYFLKYWPALIPLWLC